MAWAEGNKWGRLGAPVSDAIRKAALAGDSKRLRAAADRLLDSAAYGESWQERIQACAFIADRLEGKATQRIEAAAEGARELDLAQVLQLVLSARASSATDAEYAHPADPQTQQIEQIEQHPAEAAPAAARPDDPTP